MVSLMRKDLRANKKNKENVSEIEEFRDVLIKISIVTKRLAENLDKYSAKHSGCAKTEIFLKK